MRLPRFEVEYSIELKAALTSLGVTKPFKFGDITKARRDQLLVCRRTVYSLYAISCCNPDKLAG